MNLHLPRSATSRFETKDILNVKKQFINPQSNNPCMGSVMDTSLGLKIFTGDKIWLNKNEVINLMSYIPKFSGLLPNPDDKENLLWSGKQVFSMILPKVNYYENGDDGKISTLIEKGKFIKGTVSKRMIGTGSRGLIQIIFNDYGPNETRDFLNNIQVLMCHWLKTVCFSVGISDVIPDIITNQKIQDIINDTDQAVLKTINDTENTFHLDSSEIVRADFELKAINKLNSSRDIVGAMASINTHDNNAIKKMVSISKGSFVNICQIMATVGQQSVSHSKTTGRVPDSFEGRPIPHFPKYDDTPNCRGFIKNSYYSGLTMIEFFYHHMSGREGLIDTAVKTSETGYIQRQLVKMMEDMIVQYDHTTRNESMNVVQYLYGGDGMDPCSIEKQPIPKYLLNMEVFNKTFQYIVDGELKNKKEFDKLKELKKTFEKNYYYLEYIFLPVNIPRMIQNFTSRVKDSMKKCDMNYNTVYNIINEFCNELDLYPNRNNSILNDINHQATMMLRIMLHMEFSYNKVQAEGICEALLLKMLGEIKKKFYSSIMQPGSAAGILTAQSLGEPCTQLSVEYNTNVIVKHGVKSRSVKIGEFIDELMKEYETDRITTHITESGESHILNIPEEWNYSVPSITSNEKIEWGRLTQISRHPPNGQLVRVKTRTGREITTTLAHSFVTRKNNSVIKIRGDELKIDDFLPVIQNLESKNLLTEIDGFELNEKYGYEISYQLTDKIPEWSINAPLPFIKGLTSRFLKQELHFKSRELLEGISILLSRLGILSSIDESFHCQNYYHITIEEVNVTSDVLWDTITSIEYINTEDKYVYDFSVDKNETFSTLHGLIVHNTLNSIDYLDNICIHDGKKNFVGKIGEFIESEIKEASKENIKYLENDTTYVDVSHKEYKVVCVDEDGKTHWKLLEAVTKHLPGKDGKEKLLKVTTKGGRIVRATKAKSFLARRNNKIIGVTGDELKIGERLPITIQFPEIERSNVLNLSYYLPKNEYLYGSELYKAKRTKEENLLNNNRNWWKNNVNKEFIVPYKRSDTCIDALNKKQNYTDGCVYPKISNRTKTKIPEIIPLDIYFGFFIGAYLAEGGVSDKFIHISNNDQNYMDKITHFLNMYNIGYHIRSKTDSRFEGSLSTNMYIHSTLLRDLMFNMCGTGSDKKYVPSFAFTANKEFIKGLLDGYISGDGTISVKEKAILATSISEELLYGIMDLLSIFGIYSTKSKKRIVLSNNIGSQNIKPHWTISIRNKYVQKFIDNITLTEMKKQNKLLKFNNHKYPKKCFCNDIIPGIETNTLKGDYRRDELEKMLVYTKLYKEEELNIIQSAVNSDVYFDTVISIEEVDSSYSHVFDFTVKDTRNFSLLGGLHIRDTFHSAGIASKTNITSGVPRIKELITLSKKPKTPSMTVYINGKTKDEIDIAKNKLEYTSLSDILLQSKIYFDPDITNSKITEDAKWLAYDYKLYNEESLDEMNYSMYVIRIEICSNELYERSLSVEYIQNQILETHSKKNLHIMIKDENSNHIHMYIRTFKQSTTLKEIKSLENLLLNTKICGHSGIKRTFLRKETSNKFINGTLENTNDYVIDTEGTNLHEIMGQPYVNEVNTYSNNVNEMLEVFGIFSCARSLEIEIEKVMQSSGIFINMKHIELLARSMTCKGIVLPVNRHGSKKSNRGPLSRSSFEETNEQLTIAAIHNEIDYFKGVSSNIIMAQIAPIGTGKCELCIDVDKLDKL